jgi:hypothetical protein
MVLYNGLFESLPATFVLCVLQLSSIAFSAKRPHMYCVLMAKFVLCSSVHHLQVLMGMYEPVSHHGLRDASQHGLNAGMGGNLAAGSCVALQLQHVVSPPFGIIK